ncbi:MAG TPA: hypothetical protein PLK12_10445 [Prolixibacteraceae bacterium]|nr:hypothetical protein [Prolixibacteraceae bacterium]
MFIEILAQYIIIFRDRCSAGPKSPIPGRMLCPYKLCVGSSNSGLLYVPAFDRPLPGQGVSAPRYPFGSRRTPMGG